jgi:hypothetical protein
MRVRARGKHEIVFQLLLVTVKNQVGSRVDIRVLYTGISRNVALPGPWVITDQVGHLSRKRLHSGNLGDRIGADELHSQSRGTGSASAPHQYRFVALQEKGAMRASHQELHPGIGLPAILLEI